MNEDNLNPWQKWKQSLGDTRPWDLINSKIEFATAEVQKSRLDICLSCPELIQLTKQCKKCGCFMSGKTKIQKAECPIGKW